jgi:hypothetical protein
MSAVEDVQERTPQICPTYIKNYRKKVCSVEENEAMLQNILLTKEETGILERCWRGTQGAPRFSQRRSVLWTRYNASRETELTRHGGIKIFDKNIRNDMLIRDNEMSGDSSVINILLVKEN